jgi:hypothetical protein
MEHLLLDCVFSREVRFRLLRIAGLQHPTPMHDEAFPDWWCFSRKRVPKQLQSGFDTLAVLTDWCIWREKNNRIFNSAMGHTAQLTSWIMEEARCWRVAGGGLLLA